MTMNETASGGSEGLHLVVRGRVQGVGFRAFVQAAAIRLDLTGWVRNRWDGSVEIHAEGSRPALERFLSEMRRGPRASNVAQVDVAWQPPEGTYADFYVRRTE